MYWNANGSSELTVTSLDEDVTIQSIVINCVNDFGNAAVLANGAIVSAIDGVYTINSSSFVVTNSNTSNVQVRITSIVITYGTATGPEAPTITAADDAPVGESLNVTIAVPEGVAAVLYTDDGTDPTDEDNGPTRITSNATINVTSTSTFKAVSVDAAGNYSAVVTKTVNFYPVIEELSALKSAARGTYYVELENAIVTYVNGKNAFIEDTEVGALIFMDNHGFNEGDCLNDVFKAVTTTFNGAFELTTLESYSGDVTPNVEIPCTTLTLAQLSANFAAYESKRVKIEDVTVTDAIGEGR